MYRECIKLQHVLSICHTSLASQRPFTQIYNGGTSLSPAGMGSASLTILSLTTRSIQMDQGLGGCGAVFGTQWMQLALSNEWSQTDIMAKELVPIVLSCAIWGPILAGHGVKFKCDNQGVMDSICKGLPRSHSLCICYDASGSFRHILASE